MFQTELCHVYSMCTGKCLYKCEREREGGERGGRERGEGERERREREGGEREGVHDLTTCIKRCDALRLMFQLIL